MRIENIDYEYKNSVLVQLDKAEQLQIKQELADILRNMGSFLSTQTHTLVWGILYELEN